jgi:nicotinamidase-related amidase
MNQSEKNALQLFQELKADKSRPRFGFGQVCCMINIDLQRGFVDTVNFNGYEMDPEQISHINRLSRLCRDRGMPVVWTQNVHGAEAEDFGVRALRRPGPDAVQGMLEGAPCTALDSRCDVDRTRDFIIKKRMPSSFFETHLGSLMVARRVDTLIVTGGATSGCVRATVVDGFSRGYRVIVPEECVADADAPAHFANLRDMARKYADVITVSEAEGQLRNLRKLDNAQGGDR